MKTVKKNVYYCDHCKKRSLSATAMVRHEKYCTGYTERKCRLCEKISGVSPNPESISFLVEKYKKSFEIIEHESADDFGGGKNFTFKWTGEKIKPGDILDEVDGCPACALTIVRLSGLSGPLVPRDEFEYKYEKEIGTFWLEMNAQRDQMDYGIDY